MALLRGTYRFTGCCRGCQGLRSAALYCKPMSKSCPPMGWSVMGLEVPPALRLGWKIFGATPPCVPTPKLSKEESRTAGNVLGPRAHLRLTADILTFDGGLMICQCAVQTRTPCNVDSPPATPCDLERLPSRALLLLLPRCVSEDSFRAAI